MRRRAFTLVELAVAMGIGTLLIVIAYNCILLMTRSERSIDRESLAAITESTMMQTLLMDLRSSTGMPAGGPDVYTITRLVLPPGGGKLVEKIVTWKSDEKAQRVTRTCDGEPAREFTFAGLLDPKRTAVRLRVERTADAMFKP